MSLLKDTKYLHLKIKLLPSPSFNKDIVGEKQQHPHQPHHHTIKKCKPPPRPRLVYKQEKQIVDRSYL